MKRNVHTLVAKIPQDAGQVLIGVFALQDARYAEQSRCRRQFAGKHRSQRGARFRRVGKGILEDKSIFHLGAEKGCGVSFVAVGRDIARVHTIGGNQEDIGKPVEVGVSGDRHAG